MNRKEKLRRRNRILFLIFLAVILIVAALYFLVFRKNNKLVIKEEFETIEYGTKFEYKDMIEEIKMDDAKVTFPNFKPTQVGKYELPIVIKNEKKEVEETLHFEIVDTRTPKMKLFIKKENVEIPLSKEYDIAKNIQTMENIDASILNNKISLKEKEYNKLREKIEAENKKILERIITKEKDIKTSDITKSALFYTTNLDVNKKGVYKISVSIVDENYNLTEESWNIKVVDGGNVLNSGGSITCNYAGDDLEETEAYTTTVIENYQYNPLKLVTSYEIVTTMAFKEDYDTDENKNSLINAFNENYVSYQEEKGITLSISADGSSVVAKVMITMNEYDKKKDVLKILKAKDGSEVKITTVLKTAKKNNYACQ